MNDIKNQSEERIMTKIKDIINAIFKKNKAKPGYALDFSDWLQLLDKLKLNPRQIELFPKVIESLEKDGYVEALRGENGINSLRLTQKGYESIY